MNETLKKAWRIARWPLGLVLLAYVAFAVYRIPAVTQQEETARAVERIHAQRLTMADARGENLPPEPDAAENDATLVGVDKNANGIRDDVELAIFRKYPDDIKTRAALLQYAKVLQTELVSVYNSDTLVAVMQEENRAYFCVGSFLDDPKFDEEISLLEKLVLNTTQRQKQYQEIYRKYMTSFGDLQSSEDCDYKE